MRRLLRLVATLAALLAAPPAYAQTAAPADTAAADSLAAAAADTSGTVAVVMGGDTLFRIAQRIGPFTPQARVRAIESRVNTLLRDPFLENAEVSVYHGDVTSDLMIGDVVVMTVTDGDAAVIGLPRAAAAERYAEILEAAVRERALSTNVRSLLLGILYALLVTAVLVFLLVALQRGFRRLYATIRLRGPERLPAIRIQNLVLVPKSRMVRTLVFAARFLRFLLTLLLLYFYVPLVLSFFVWTRDLAGRWLQYVLDPVSVVGAAIVAYLPNLFFILVIILVTYYVLKVVHLVFDGIASGTIAFQGFYPEWAEPTYKILRVVVIALAVILAWPYLPQSDSTAFKGVAAFLGLLLSIGSASAIANVVGGVVMVYMRPFQLGDRVQIADTVGDVIEKTLLVTRVRTSKNVEITIPNSMVLGSHIVNYSNSAREGRLILHTSVTIGYDVEWRKVHDALVAAARGTEGVKAEPAPFVLQTALGDYAVTYELNAYTDEASHMARIYSELHQAVQDRCAEAGIEILSPAYAAWRDGNPSTIPGAAKDAGGAGGEAQKKRGPGAPLP